MVLDVATINVSLPGVDLYVNKVSVARFTSLGMHMRILTPVQVQVQLPEPGLKLPMWDKRKG